jgi:hypothetical protein
MYHDIISGYSTALVDIAKLLCIVCNVYSSRQVLQAVIYWQMTIKTLRLDVVPSMEYEQIQLIE